MRPEVMDAILRSLTAEELQRLSLAAIQEHHRRNLALQASRTRRKPVGGPELPPDADEESTT